MTEKTDSDATTEDAGSDRTTDQKLDANVIARSPRDDPDVYLVQYPDGEQQYEPATPTNVALFEDDVYASLSGNSGFTVSTGDDTVSVELDADVFAKEYVLRVDGETVPVPDDYIPDVVDAFTYPNSTIVGSKLYSLYTDITEGQVRRHTIGAFLDRYPSDRIETTPNGWVVDDTFIVTYEGTNHLVDVDPTDPYGGDVDDSAQAVYLDIDPDGSRTVTAPDGESVELDPVEQTFLTTVEGLLYPEDYFGVELVDEIQQHKTDGEVLDDVIEDLTEQADVTGFTDSKTGIHHGSTNHDFRKHDVRDLNVTESVRDKLWSNPYDHAGVHELLLRKQEFINNPDVDVFRDQPDDSEWKWDEIERTSENAPIPTEVRDKLDRMFA